MIITFIPKDEIRTENEFQAILDRWKFADCKNPNNINFKNLQSFSGIFLNYDKKIITFALDVCITNDEYNFKHAKYRRNGRISYIDEPDSVEIKSFKSMFSDVDLYHIARDRQIAYGSEFIPFDSYLEDINHGFTFKVNFYAGSMTDIRVPLVNPTSSKGYSYYTIEREFKEEKKINHDVDKELEEEFSFEEIVSILEDNVYDLTSAQKLELINTITQG